jgi:cleavage and polyadenylation specificity factor subunit 1
LAVSLNVKDRVHAVVWNVSGLPMTINQCISLPAPVGGACLIGNNEIIYLNQAVPPCGLALNSDADEFTRFPFATETKSLRLTLDGCAVEVLSEGEILIATRNAELYLLTLNVDISNSVKQMRIQKVFEATIPYTLTACYPGYVFLGSKLGDSVLLSYTRDIAQHENGTQHNQTAKDQDVVMDEDDIYLYKSGPAENEVCF